MKIKIKKNELIDLYYNKKKSYSEICKIYNCHAQTIGNRLKEFNLKPRSISESLKGRKHTWGNKISNSLKGKKRSGIGGVPKGTIPWNKDKTKNDYPELFKNCNMKLSDEHKLALCNGQNKIYNKIEQLVGKSYGYLKYTGDKNFWVKFKDGTHKNPDFILKSLNGGYFKIAIEVFGNYWHKDDDPQELIKKYNDVGWRCMVLWENEILELYKEHILFDKIDRFINYDIYDPCVSPYDEDYCIHMHLLSDEIKEGLI